MAAKTDLDFSPVRRERVQEQVYQGLRNRLMSGQFRPGQPLKLIELAEAFNTSAMPIREALTRLVAERALDNAPNRSIVVPILSQERLDDLRQVRKTVEGLAARLAVPRMTTSVIAKLAELAEHQASLELRDEPPIAEIVSANLTFHFTLYAQSDSEVLLPIIESLWLQFGPQLRHASTVSEKGAARGVRFHRQMVDAFRRRDADAVASALEADVDLSFNLTHPPAPTKARAKRNTDIFNV